MSTGEGTTEMRWARITQLVDAALEYPDPDKRARFLDRACDGEQELRREIEHLLRFEDAECEVLDDPPVPPGAAEAVASLLERAPGARLLEPGRRFGPYRIEKVLGEGGMGVVALAHEAELDRRVALKLLHQERLTPELLRRFESERRILARLDHPGIARILEAGTLEGLPFFTMEVVDGEPIDAYCDRRCLSVTERLELMLEVADALACAHRNLVIHRDLDDRRGSVAPGPRRAARPAARRLGAGRRRQPTGRAPSRPGAPRRGRSLPQRRLRDAAPSTRRAVPAYGRGSPAPRRARIGALQRAANRVRKSSTPAPTGSRRLPVRALSSAGAEPRIRRVGVGFSLPHFEVANGTS